MSLGQKVKESILAVLGFLVPVFQFVPNSWMFWGPMSMPLIAYFSSLSYLPHLWDEITNMLFDFSFLFGWHGLQELAGVIFVSFLVLILRGIILGGILLFIYSLHHLFTHRGRLVQTGPYGWVRHPQYLGMLMVTTGITIGVVRTDPVWVWGSSGTSVDVMWILVVWFLQALAYVVLAKIEEVGLRSRYGEAHVRYAKSVPFIIP